MNGIINYIELVGVSIALGWMIKAVPEYLSSLAVKEFESILQRSDPADSELAIAVVRWIEAKIPAQGVGDTKYKIAADKIVSLCPWLKGQDQKIQRIIEDSVVKMKQSIDAEIDKNKK